MKKALGSKRKSNSYFQTKKQEKRRGNERSQKNIREGKRKRVKKLGVGKGLLFQLRGNSLDDAICQGRGR